MKDNSSVFPLKKRMALLAALCAISGLIAGLVAALILGLSTASGIALSLILGAAALGIFEAAAVSRFLQYRHTDSILEAADAETGERRTIHIFRDSVIESPNWTPDGKGIIYNEKGRLFRI